MMNLISKTRKNENGKRELERGELQETEVGW